MRPQAHSCPALPLNHTDMLRKAVGVALLGACAYAVADNTADSLMYLRTKRWGGGQGVCEAGAGRWRWCARGRMSFRAAGARGPPAALFHPRVCTASCLCPLSPLPGPHTGSS